MGTFFLNKIVSEDSIVFNAIIIFLIAKVCLLIVADDVSLKTTLSTLQFNNLHTLAFY